MTYKFTIRNAAPEPQEDQPVEIEFWLEGSANPNHEPCVSVRARNTKSGEEKGVVYIYANGDINAYPSSFRRLLGKEMS